MSRCGLGWLLSIPSIFVPPPLLHRRCLEFTNVPLQLHSKTFLDYEAANTDNATRPKILHYFSLLQNSNAEPKLNCTAFDELNTEGVIEGTYTCVPAQEDTSGGNSQALALDTIWHMAWVSCAIAFVL